LVQSDGKVLIGGRFDSVNGSPRNDIARFYPDGSLDDAFNPGTGVGGPPYNPGAHEIEALALQADGKMLLGGWMGTINGTNRSGIARLNTNGSLDAGFNPVIGPYSSNYPFMPVYSVAVQSDGKVLMGGLFGTVNGARRNGIARLNADGSL